MRERKPGGLLRKGGGFWVAKCVNMGLGNVCI
jgi:hypothetical protein